MHFITVEHSPPWLASRAGCMRVHLLKESLKAASCIEQPSQKRLNVDVYHTDCLASICSKKLVASLPEVLL